MRNRKSFNIVIARNRSCGKVMFSQASVILPGGGMCGRGCALAGGVYGRQYVWQGVCMAGGVYGRECVWLGAWQGGCAWQGAWGVRDRGLVVCVAGGHTWQER